MTDAEVRLWNRRRGEQFDGYRFRRQVPMGPYVVDFACLKARLVVEVDGGQHAEAIEADKRRAAWLASRGFTVVRFWNIDVFQQIEGVLESIHEALAGPPPYPPHKGEGTTSGDQLDVVDAGEVAG